MCVVPEKNYGARRAAKERGALSCFAPLLSLSQATHAYSYVICGFGHLCPVPGFVAWYSANYLRRWAGN